MSGRPQIGPQICLASFMSSGPKGLCDLGRGRKAPEWWSLKHRAPEGWQNLSNIPRVVFDAMPFEQLNQFLLKAHFTMMRFLVTNV